MLLTSFSHASDEKPVSTGKNPRSAKSIGCIGQPNYNAGIGIALNNFVNNGGGIGLYFEAMKRILPHELQKRVIRYVTRDQAKNLYTHYWLRKKIEEEDAPITIETAVAENKFNNTLA